jgi:hypothetical protein
MPPANRYGIRCSVHERDYILRLIEQASQAVTRALKLLLLEQPDEVERELVAAYSALGMDCVMLCALDGASIRSFFGDQEKLVLAVRVLLCESRLERTRSDIRGATKLLRAARKVCAQIDEPSAELRAELEGWASSLE